MIIYYGNKKNQDSFRFNGKNGKDAPDDPFVQKFLMAYDYNIKNGGAQNTLDIATNSDYSINIKQLNSDGGRYVPDENTIYWNPNVGLETDQGVKMSPASIFEHEADHAKAFNDDPNGYRDRVSKSDSKFKNLEERRVVLGSEQRVTLANGERKKNQITRHNYGNSVIRYYETMNPRSTYQQYNENRLLQQIGFYKAISNTNGILLYKYPQLYYRNKK